LKEGNSGDGEERGETCRRKRETRRRRGGKGDPVFLPSNLLTQGSSRNWLRRWDVKGLYSGKKESSKKEGKNTHNTFLLPFSEKNRGEGYGKEWA